MNNEFTVNFGFWDVNLCGKKKTNCTQQDRGQKKMNFTLTKLPMMG